MRTVLMVLTSTIFLWALAYQMFVNYNIKVAENVTKTG